MNWIFKSSIRLSTYQNAVKRFSWNKLVGGQMNNTDATMWSFLLCCHTDTNMFWGKPELMLIFLKVSENVLLSDSSGFMNVNQMSSPIANVFFTYLYLKDTLRSLDHWPQTHNRNMHSTNESFQSKCYPSSLYLSPLLVLKHMLVSNADIYCFKV